MAPSRMGVQSNERVVHLKGPTSQCKKVPVFVGCSADLVRSGALQVEELTHCGESPHPTRW